MRIWIHQQQSRRNVSKQAASKRMEKSFPFPPNEDIPPVRGLGFGTFYDGVTYNPLSLSDEPLYDNNQVASLTTISESLAALQPYLQSAFQDSKKTVKVLEIYPDGSSGDMSSMTLKQLLTSIHESVASIDKKARKKPRESRDSPTQFSSSAMHRTKSFESMESLNETKRSIREIQYHDLRHLEHQFHRHEEPNILIRRHGILMSLNPLRLVFMHDKIIFIVPDGADQLLYLLHEHLNSIAEDEFSFGDDASVSFELRSYRAIFATVLSLHIHSFNILQESTNQVVQIFKGRTSVSLSNQEVVRELKNSNASLMVKMEAYCRLFGEIKERDEDLALMNLTLLKNKPHLYQKPLADEILAERDEFMNLCESYANDYTTLRSKLEYLRLKIQYIEEAMQFRLDSSRNQLLIIEMNLEILMVTIAIGTYITSLFGMNLDSGLEDTDTTFWIIVVISSMIILCTTIFLFMFYYRKRGGYHILDSLGVFFRWFNGHESRVPSPPTDTFE